MKISVIIPAYNEERYLPQCLNSILAQQVPDMEILVVDDGSRDGTLALAQNYSRRYPQVRVIVHPENRGLGAARNTGLRNAHGAYLVFVDADDFLMPGSLAQICAALRGDLVLLTSCKQKDGAVTSPFRFFDAGDFSGDPARILHHLTEKEIFFGSACDKAVRRTFLLQNQLFFPEGRLKETISWCVQILLHAQSVSFCNAQYYYYRQRGKHSLSGQISRRSLEDVIISLEECVERIESSSADPLRRQACFCFLTTPFLFAAEYMADFGNKALEAKLKSCAWLLYYSHDRECIRARRVLKVLGFHLGTLYLREKAKARYRKRRPK